MPFAASSSKALLAFIPLLLLPYSFNTQALSATTANTIQGTAPYLTFDGGTTKVTTTDGLLGIKLSDGTIPTPNSTTPITLPVAGETFADIEMLVPAVTPPVSASDPTQTINLNALIGAPYNYWGDDDNDGLGASGITATGSLSVVITDKNGTKVNRSDTLDICDAPYKVVLSSTAGSLSTQYGDPRSSAFTAANATYFINPNAIPKICFAKPFSMHYATGQYAGPSSIWDGGTTGGAGIQSNGRGFKIQSTSLSSYNLNFPTTGANNLFFDLEVAGIDASSLTWSAVTHNGITATMTPDISGESVRVVLTGPTLVPLSNPAIPGGTFPVTFELEGKNSGATVLKYGFSLAKWFANSNTGKNTAQAPVKTWCSGSSYRIANIGDVTNASGPTSGWSATIPGATPASGGNYVSRNIGTGLVSEWGALGHYTSSGFIGSTFYWAQTYGTGGAYFWYADTGAVMAGDATALGGRNMLGLCVTP